MTSSCDLPIKIRSISIRNYKGVDELDLEFPRPRLSDDPDIFVMGSRNGLGKSSIIECCALLLLTPVLREKLCLLNQRNPAIDIPDLLIRSGADCTEIRGRIVSGDDTTIAIVQIRIDRHGGIKLSGMAPFKKYLKKKKLYLESTLNEPISAICGFTSNPVIERTFMLFHSYRKVQEGNLEIGMMLDSPMARFRPGNGRDFSLSVFKLQILRSLMAQARLFDLDEDERPNGAIETLNDLMKTYAGGTVSKLRLSTDSTVDFRVDPVMGGESYTFDALSSGQKEIISTLFSIWYHTKDIPSVVFIDGPELHLNTQWHCRVVKHMVNLAPENQYIIATHSKDVMDAVAEDKRALLTSEMKPEND